MLNLGIISFAAPWVLAAAAALPLVWLLLRLTPPAVRQIEFPAIRLLFDLDPTQRTAAHTPPWLIILRIGILLLVLLGLADPVLNLRPAGERSGPVVIAFDNGWAAANQWDSRVKALHNILESAERRDQQVAVIPTAPAASTTPPHLTPAEEALAAASQITPQPWSTDRAAAAAQLAALKVGGNASAVWISDGVDSAGAGALAAALEHIGPLTTIDAGAAAPALVQLPPERSLTNTATDTTANGVQVKLLRAATRETPASTHAVRAIDNDGQVVGESTVTFGAGAREATGTLTLPTELANRVARFDVAGVASAATTVLADDRWQRRPVGIASATASGIRAPLLENAYYIKEALAPYADVRSGDLNALLARPLAVLIMADGGKILDEEVNRLTSWVNGGGLLVRFAGPGLESNVDSLLPVQLRSGGRSFGGTMSWNTPAPIAPFPENSPFKDLLVPDDVTVSSQVLAEPSADLTNKTWARLKDGTPLVTAVRRGQGWIVLFHVTATPEWSKLPLSGLFVDMLRRLVDISRGVQGEASDVASGLLAPRTVLDGFGRLGTPGPIASAIDAETFATTKPGPTTPPGIYGQPGATRALNLSSSIGALKPLSAPMGATRATFEASSTTRVLKPWLLTAALILLLADLVISLALRRLLPDGHRLARGATAVALLLCFTAAHGRAAETEIDPTIRAAILETRLAYIATGNAQADRLTAAGLDTLTQVLAARTAAELAEPTRLDLAGGAVTADALIPYPLIYWRMSPQVKLPPPRAMAALNAYLHRGGLIVFDAPDQPGATATDGKNQARLDQILQNLDIPPVVRMADDHVLNRSFYLLRQLPGRYVNQDVLVERGTNANDGASSVIIGANDWAGAWAKDANGVPMQAVVPGGETQREMAYRAGINMVMYALTGNYKDDQVHLPAIMQRLTQ
jgi:hypothetical protein